MVKASIDKLLLISEFHIFFTGITQGGVKFFYDINHIMGRV
jgi:hypothetical protein